MTKLYHAIFNIALAALIVYAGVDTFLTIAHSWAPQAKTDLADLVSPPRSDAGTRPLPGDIQIIVKRNLFGSLDKESETTAAVKEEEVEGLEPTSLKLRLLGTVAGDPRNARAVIEETDNKKQGLFRVGDSIQDAMIKRILREKIILRVGAKDEVLSMEEPASSEKKQKPPLPGPGNRELSRLFSPTTNWQPSAIMLRKADLQETLKDFNQMLTSARVQPHVANGKSDGMVISRITRGSVFSRLGLRNGDIIQTVNGKALANPGDLSSLYQSLQTGTTASIKIMRRGRQKEINYQLK